MLIEFSKPVQGAPKSTVSGWLTDYQSSDEAWLNEWARRSRS